MEHLEDLACIKASHEHQIDILSRQKQTPINPSLSVLRKAEADLFLTLPEHGLGIKKTTDHLLGRITPAFNGASLSPNYYGFVTGGVTPAAQIGDNIVSVYDQNVQVHLPDQTIATAVEDRALALLLDLLRFNGDLWAERTFTTGATSSNLLGLACGREYVVNRRLAQRSTSSVTLKDNAFLTVAEQGLLPACRAAGVENIQVLSTMPHSSLKKAASILGFGRSYVLDVSEKNNPLAFDLETLEARLDLPNTVSIVVLSCGEVNTGFFATHSFKELNAIRSLCDRYGAWLHVDAAFGIFARTLDVSLEFERTLSGCDGLELADSITGDAHKVLNVPYDCGFFFSRHKNLAQEVFRNSNAAYLNDGAANSYQLQSPLNIGIENSRRFRALPVYATLLCYGRSGYRDMLQRQIRLARALAVYFFQHPAFELLPKSLDHETKIEQEIFIVVLFRAKNNGLNDMLVSKINATSKTCVTGTLWEGHPASRIAVSNWQANPDRDFIVVKSVIEAVLCEWEKEMR